MRGRSPRPTLFLFDGSPIGTALAQTPLSVVQPGQLVLYPAVGHFQELVGLMV